MVIKRYQYFDHTIESEFELPELKDAGRAETPSTITVHLADDKNRLRFEDAWCHHWKTSDDITTLSLAKNSDGFLLKVPRQGKFKISADGKKIFCYPEVSIPRETIRHLLLDQILPRVFAHFYVDPVFHASCVSTSKRGICFLGDTGVGKSTLAAAFGHRGYTVLTDDCLALSISQQQIISTPSYNGIRLWSDSLSALSFSDWRKDSCESQGMNKTRILLKKQTFSKTLLRAIFLLTSSQEAAHCDEPEIVPVSKSIAVKELLKNSFSLDIHDSEYLKRHFFQIIHIVSTGIPVFTLRYPRNFNQLPDLIYSIERIL